MEQQQQQQSHPLQVVQFLLSQQLSKQHLSVIFHFSYLVIIFLVFYCLKANKLPFEAIQQRIDL